MADAKDIIESLRVAQDQIAGRRDPVNAFNRIEVAIDLIEHQAAEIERLTKPMTLERAVELMNEVQHEDAADWEIIEYSNAREAFSLMAAQDYIEFAAIAVAEKIERERESENG